MSALIAVVIPAYNGETYIGAAIESVLAQTFRDYDLWVVDDCSTDGTMSVVKRFGDPRLRVVANSHNLGLIGNWNRCIDIAEGQLVLILHQDDCLSPTMVAEVVHFFDSHPSVGLIAAGGEYMDARGRVNRWARVVRTRYRRRGVPRVLAAGDASVGCLIKHGVAISGVVVPRTIYERFGKFDPAMPYSADEELWARIAARRPMGLLPGALVYQRTHAGQFRDETWKRGDFLEQYLAVRRRCFSYLSRDGQRAWGGDGFAEYSVARAGAMIALRSIAVGDLERAQYYLNAAEQLCPRITQDPLHRVARCLRRVPRLGQMVCSAALGLG